ncbi:cupin domain-containing protein [Geodermatophilus chilensis]|uniref:cupin domain-containing protein n=1 Tax=Geodermatophilus chilensis TaxID=2035835 RepID=UPI0013000456|nr:cupin domain-containing protein [Geodermatophilus chilensis]
MMELLTLPARQLSSYGSSGAELLRAALVQDPQDGFAVDVVRLAPGGSIGRHPTRLWQLFLVVSGNGWVSGAEGERRPVTAGAAALWAPGEDHASGSDDGLTAVVVQCHARPLTAT